VTIMLTPATKDGPAIIFDSREGKNPPALVVNGGASAGKSHPPTAPQAASTILARADSCVNGGTNANSSFGTANQMIVKQSKSAQLNRRAYIKFSMTNVSKTFTSAVFRIYGKLSSTASANIMTNIYDVPDQTWTEPALTYNNRPGFGMKVGSFVVVNTHAKYYEIDVTAYLKKQQKAGKKLISLMLANATVSNAQSVFNSRETITPPELVVT
jgi:hypothetical protein